MEVLVYGAGALGSLVGGLLARVHDVTLVGRDPHMRRIRDDGLHIEGTLEATVHPRALTDGYHRSAAVALVTTKAYDTDAAARALSTGEYEVVCSLQNGLTEERLVASLDPPVLAGTTSYGARLLEPGRVRCTGVGTVSVGSIAGGESPLAARVVAAFVDAGIETTAATDMPRRRFTKLAVNAGLNGPSALARTTNGETMAGPGREAATEAAREVARVARAAGISLTETEAVEALESVADATAANHSSMRADVDAGRQTEVEALYGAITTRADDHAVSVPTCRTIASLLEAWEASRDLDEP
jgi:2-dehydropantoate 2-reductase